MLYLWDIDGTLVRCGGAGRDAMNLAFEAVYGVREGFQGVDFRGNVDSRLYREQCQRWGVASTPQSNAMFQSRYVAALTEGLRPAGRTDQVRCPGVPAILQKLAGHGTLGLVTGNWRAGAEVKLRAFGLWEWFQVGAFGEDADQREGLVALAIQRAREMGVDVGRVVMTGDTPDDVRAARAGGARAVAVQTGWSDVASLRAAGPDALLVDLAFAEEIFLGMKGRRYQPGGPM